MAQRIKGMRQKNSQGTFNSLIPFGTDGMLVDMLSGLDNEQELKLGGNHTATIEEIENDNILMTRITEVYKNKLGTIDEYTVVTEISDSLDNSTTINSTLYQGNTNVILNAKTITIPADGSFIEEVLS